jgi:hypothetical protein
MSKTLASLLENYFNRYPLIEQSRNDAEDDDDEEDQKKDDDEQDDDNHDDEQDDAEDDDGEETKQKPGSSDIVNKGDPRYEKAMKDIGQERKDYKDLSPKEFDRKYPKGLGGPGVREVPKSKQGSDPGKDTSKYGDFTRNYRQSTNVVDTREETMDKITLDAVMEEIKKSLGDARLMKIFEAEDDPETIAKNANAAAVKAAMAPGGQHDQAVQSAMKSSSGSDYKTPVYPEKPDGSSAGPGTSRRNPGPVGTQADFDSAMKSSGGSSGSSDQEDQNKTGTSPATAGSQPTSTMASPGDRAAFDKKTGADKARTDAGAAELAQRTLKPLVPGSSTAPSAPGAVRPLSAPSAPIKPITGPTKNDSDVKTTTTNGPGSQSQTSSWSGTLKPGESKTVGASASSSSSKSTGSNWSSAAQTAGERAASATKPSGPANNMTNEPLKPSGPANNMTNEPLKPSGPANNMSNSTKLSGASVSRSAAAKPSAPAAAPGGNKYGYAASGSDDDTAANFFAASKRETADRASQAAPTPSARPAAPAPRPSAPAPRPAARPAAPAPNLSKVTPGSAADSMRKRYAPGGGGSAGNTPMVAENFDQFVKKFLKESK